MTRRARCGANIISLFLLAEEDEVNDYANEDDVDCPLVRSLPEQLLQPIADRVEAEDEK